jgi:nucleotide-binding universal stress UspA family protein
VAAHIQALQAAAKPLAVALSPRVRRGSDLADEIVAEARSAQADLLVIRRRGKRSFLSRLLVGEMVSQVVARAPCSVLVAPRAAVMWRTAVMVGVDPQAPDAACVAVAAALAAECRVPLWLACVAESGSDRPHAEAAATRALQQALVWHADTRADVLTGRAAPALLAAAAQRGADLLVVSRHRPGARSGAAMGSTAEAVTGLASGPVLVHVGGDGDAAR